DLRPGELARGGALGGLGAARAPAEDAVLRDGDHVRVQHVADGGGGWRAAAAGALQVGHAAGELVPGGEAAGERGDAEPVLREAGAAAGVRVVEVHAGRVRHGELGDVVEAALAGGAAAEPLDHGAGLHAAAGHEGEAGAGADERGAIPGHVHGDAA